MDISKYMVGGGRGGVDGGGLKSNVDRVLIVMFLLFYECILSLLSHKRSTIGCWQAGQKLVN